MHSRTAWNQKRTEEIIEEHRSLEGAALPILHALQAEFGYIDRAAVQLVADALNLSRAEVHGVVSFYHDFRETPPGGHVLKLCRAEACQSMGAETTFINAERRIGMVRTVMRPKNGYADWEITQLIARAMGMEWNYTHPSQIMDEIARLTPTFAGVSFERLETESLQWPVNDKAPHGTPIMHIGSFVRGKGNFLITEYVPTDERTGPRFPLLLTTGRILSQYNVGAQTRRTDNTVWHGEDRLEIHPHDAEQRGIRDGDWVRLASRAGGTTLRAKITDRVAPGVVYTTFHHPETQANVVTTDYSDWATNCPEYKVTAVQVAPSNGPTEWQTEYGDHARQSRRIARPASATAAE